MLLFKVDTNTYDKKSSCDLWHKNCIWVGRQGRHTFRNYDPNQLRSCFPNLLAWNGGKKNSLFYGMISRMSNFFMSHCITKIIIKLSFIESLYWGTT